LANFIIGLIGCLVLTYGLYSAIIEGSPYWYGYFVSGLFLFLDRCDVLLNHDSNLTRLFNQNWRTPVYTYLVYLAGGLIIDLVFGIYIGNLWVYPHFNAIEKFINVILITYPFLFFNCAVFYRVLAKLLQNFTKSLPQIGNKSRLPLRRLGIIILLFTILSTCFPIIYFFIFGKMHIQGVIVICGLFGIFSLSPIALILRQKSLLERILNQDWSAIMALLCSIPINALINEVPNTFAWQWRYQNMPFASLEILGVPVLVLTLGWAYLTIFGISGNELFFHASN
jgi:hypothetical protein